LVSVPDGPLSQLLLFALPPVKLFQLLLPPPSVPFQ